MHSAHIYSLSLNCLWMEIMRSRGFREESLFYPWLRCFFTGSVGRLHKANVEKWKQMEGMII